MKKKAVVIVGPTASGKTSLGVYVAEKFNGEVISADSMQIYKDMSVSTAKPTTEEMRGIKHHLIDFVELSEQYSVSSYCDDARKVFDDIVSRGKLPVIVGGTGLYIDCFLTNTQFFSSASSQKIRDELKLEAEQKGIDALYAELLSVDPVAAQKIHPNNKVRVLRALEVYRITGKTLSQQTEQSRLTQSDIEPLYIGITYKERAKLYERIDKRVDIMLQNGLVDEAKKIFSSDISQTAVKSIGCKELKPYLDGKSTLTECVEKLKLSTRHYAKRQLTWFRRNEKINWVYPDVIDDIYSYTEDLMNTYLAGDNSEK